MPDLLDKAESEAASLPATRAPSTDIGSVLERLASSPDVDVAKLEKMIDLQERILRYNAKSEFDAAFSEMAPELPVISEKGEIVVGQKVRSRYAKLEDIQAAVKPVLKKFGFAIRHRTEWPGEDAIEIVGILSHKGGHSEESRFRAPMDKSEFRTDIQSQGSTISYGRRYTTIDLLNLETRGQDDDGAKAGRPTPPDSYDDAKIALSQAADKGQKALDTAFAAMDKKHREYLTQYDALDLAKMRTRARTGKAAQS